MRKVILGTLLTLSALNANAAIEVISTKSNKDFGIFDIGKNLYCEKIDTNHDGTKDTTRLSLNLQSTEAVGILQKLSISEDFPFDKNDLCKSVQTIEDQSIMNFGAGLGTYDSILVLQDGVLIEYIQVTLTSYPKEDGSTVSVTINDRIEIPTN